MFDFLNKFLKPNAGDTGLDRTPAVLDKDAIAGILRVSPEALTAFEASYQANVLSDDLPGTGNMFDVNARQAKAALDTLGLTEYTKKLNDRIIAELISRTPVMRLGRDGGIEITPAAHETALTDGTPDVTLEEILQVPENIRPQLSGNLMKKDVDANTSEVLLGNYAAWKDMSKSRPHRQTAYNMFRQGLDILDLDPVAYAMLGTNPNSIGHWLPALAQGIRNQDFFLLPETTVIRVPMTLLQLTRIQYETLTPGTFDVVNRYCHEVFNLNDNLHYFVKTGTYSSKFDFRNAHVHGPQEVRELGQYLLYIQYQAQQMAGPLSTPSMYGVSTTNEWAVREYIRDDADPCIYKGMPLRTEYRVFVDFDSNEILGINPYWDPEVMKKRFAACRNDDELHDYVIYATHEPVLMERYETSKSTVIEKLSAMLPDVPLTGQWSVDVMQDETGFYVIDMALAQNSALSGCVDKSRLRPMEENWLPGLAGGMLSLGPWA